MRKSEGGRKALPPRAHGQLRSHSHFCAKPLACCAKQEQRRICRRMRLCHVPEGEAVYEEGDTVRVRKSQACTQAGPRGRAYASINIGIQIFSGRPAPPPPASRTKLPQIADIQTVTHYHGHTGCVRPYTSSPMLSTLCALAWWTCSARQRGTVAEWTSAPESSAGLFFSCRCEQRANIF